MSGQNNAAEAQYGTPTPAPPVGTPTVGPTPTSHTLPLTGSDAWIPLGAAGVLALILAVCITTIVQPWLDRLITRRSGRDGP
jgi:hypothetical protein